MDLTLILPIHIETPADEAAVAAMLDSLEADSLSLCQCERHVWLTGKYSRLLRGRLHKMATVFVETPEANWEQLRPQNNIIELDVPCIVERGWLDRIVIEADRMGGSVRQGPATYYPRKLTST